MSAPESLWFYRTVDGEEYGPYTVPELKLYLSQGRVINTGFLRREDEEHWISVEQGIQDLDLMSPRTLNPPVSVEGLSGAAVSPTSRVAFILLGLLPGLLISFFGIHNLIAGYVGKGMTQLMITIFGIYGLSCLGIAFAPMFCVSGLFYVAMMLWVIIEICTVQVDALGRVMR